MRVYLDYNATAPLRDEARMAIMAALDETGNPSSVHAAGRQAKAKMDQSRRTIAQALSAASGDIVFTSGGTEANNLGVLGLAAANGCTHILVGAVEHTCVHAAAKASGLLVEDIAVNKGGALDLAALAQAIEALPSGAKPLLCLMLANNETGVIQPVQAATQMLHEAGGLVHIDAVQAFGKMPVRLSEIGADSLAVSAHKIGGPLGVGALALACGTKIAPNAHGGGQEFGRRGGTENVPGVAGFAAAVEAAIAELEKSADIAALRDHMQSQLAGLAADIKIFGADVPRLANTLCFAVPDFAAETQLMAMDLAGFAISSGAACSSGKVKASAVMLAMQVPVALASCAIRVSLGALTTRKELDAFVGAWGEALIRARANEAA